MNIVGIIPARGGSKGLKSKNILELDGKPLIGYTIEDALASLLLTKVVVSTDSQEIADVIRRSYDIEVIMRPAEFARDDSPIEEALLHAVEVLKEKQGIETDLVVWMQANVPFRKKGLVDEVVQKLIDDKTADSSVTVFHAELVPEVLKVIDEKGRLQPIYKDVKGIRRQEFPNRYLLDGSIVAIRAKNLFETKGVRTAHVYLGKEVIPVVQDHKMHSVEIDTAHDFHFAEFYLKRYGHKETKMEEGRKVVV